MGGGNSKLLSTQLEDLETKIKGLNTSIYQLQDSINALPKEYMLQCEFDTKIQKIEEDSFLASQQLTNLLEITKDQQQIIQDLGDQYADVCDICENQQESVELVETECKEKLILYEEELTQAKNKLVSVEEGIHRTSELAKIMGIRKTENMIKKERPSLPTHSNLNQKKHENTQKKIAVEEKSKQREEPRVTKSETKRKPTLAKSGANENEVSNRHDNQPKIVVEKKIERNGLSSTHKESLSKSDFNIF